MKDETALTVVDHSPSPLPVFSGEQMGEALNAYKKLQAQLDKSMPDQIMKIQGRDFRKKGYWRAIRMSFNLQVECISENRVSYGEDWGYEATYRATAPNGATADGDGSCMASEKRVFKSHWSNNKKVFERDRDGNLILNKEATEQNATVHNVRGHAHTRAFNRAVSNLVGFGEVSADEINNSTPDPEPSREARQKAAQKKADEQAPPQQPSDVLDKAKEDPDPDEYITYPVDEFKRETGKAVCLSMFGGDVWIAKSQILGNYRPPLDEITVTKWVAGEKGLPLDGQG